jgi:serine/threonine protein kinase/tetratricopeptide (TPR) repeat protein
MRHVDMIGRTISHYRIIEKLGEGGMGVVYKAEDVKLGRTVALKFLPPHVSDDEAAQRFVNEAHAVSSLDHPNICSIYEIDQTSEGQMFIVMPCYEGASLRAMIKDGPVELGKAVEIASEVAHGLGKAHESGIVHRDVKPANILVTKDGLAKVVDFGLAKLATQARLTRAGTTLGTAMYMSPEQARGEETDERSDIWSLGVVLYEMAAGRPPFRGEHEQAIVYSILNQTPEPLDRVLPGAPKELERVLERALSKNPRERYQRMEEMAADLDVLKDKLKRNVNELPRRGGLRGRMWIGTGIVIAAAVVAVFLVKTRFSKPEEKPITSIAVLPFQNLSADPEQEYFSDGMTEAIIKEISQISALRVISRTSVMRFKKTDKSLPEIAHELGVDAVVEGSVMRADHEVRITAQLIAAHPEKHLWADDFTRSLENILSLQSDVAQAIAREIKVAVTPRESARLAVSRPVDPEAHEAYLKGNYFWASNNPRDWYRSMEYFQQAIDKDSTYALAYAGMAKAYDSLVSMNLMSPRDAWPKVRVYAEKALSLDPNLAEGVLLMADVTFAFDWDIPRAERLYKRAIELDPNLSIAHYWYGFVLTSLGHFDEGIPEMKHGLRLDPLSSSLLFNISRAYANIGEYDSAYAYVKRAEDIADEPDAPWVAEMKCYVHLVQGKYEEAIKDGTIAASGKTPNGFELLASAYALSGHTDRARELLAELLESIGDGYYSPVFISIIYCALGDRDKVLECFESAIEQRDFAVLTQAYAPPWCDFIKSDPRYHDMMRRIGLEK